MDNRPALTERKDPIAAIDTNGTACFSSRFLCHGVRLQFLLRDHSLMALLEPLIDGLPLRQETVADTPSDLTLEVVCVDQPCRPPDAGCVDHAYGFAIRHTADYVWVSDGHSAFRTDINASRGQLVLHASFADQPLPHRLNLFLLGLTQLLAARGVYDLHGAAVLNDNQACLLVAGPGGGKSTTTTALVRAGWYYVSDDAVLLSKDESGVEVLCFRQQVSVTPSLQRWFPELGLSILSAEEDAKAFLNLELIYGRCHRMRCRPTRLLLLSRTEARSRSRLSPASARDAMTALISQTQSLSFSRGSASAHLALLAALVAQTDAYHLELGTDVLSAPETLSTLLSALPELQCPTPRHGQSPQTAISP